LTGARQVGKTTLARSMYEGAYRYLNLDSPGERARLLAVESEAWGEVVGPAVLDEVQKAPLLLEKLKWSYDEGDVDFSVVLGSSRILLLEKVRESLAGRVFLHELWPLTAGELISRLGGKTSETPLILRIVRNPAVLPATLGTLEKGVVGSRRGEARASVDHLLRWGGLPTLLQYPEEDRLEWLDAYQATYLERDLGDLARLRDLESFSSLQRLAALRAGRILSYSDLSRDAGLSVSTGRRYLRYLELSYQVFPLPAWSGNPSTRLIKAPKLVWFDMGVQRSLSGQIRGLTGEQYESAMVAQILTTLWSLGLRVRGFHLRTAGGLEVDLVLEGPEGILAVEMKNRSSVETRDASSVERARRILGSRYRGGIVVYRGEEIRRLTESVWAVPDPVLLT